MSQENIVNEEEIVKLDVLETNELVFNINVEGANTSHRARLVLENKEVSYMFDGKPTTTDGNLSFVIPEGLIIEEGFYPARIEVIVGNKILVPMKFETEFKGSINTNSDLVETTSMETPIEAKVKMLPIKRTKKSLTLKERWLSKKR